MGFSQFSWRSYLRFLVVIVKAAGLLAPKNTVFSEENITLKRSDSGVFATEWDQVIGQKSTRDYQEDEGIELD